MNKLLVIACSGIAGFGAVLLVTCILAAWAQGGWQPEAEEPGRFILPLEWLAVGGMSMLLLAPLCYLAGRSSNDGRNF